MGIAYGSGFDIPFSASTHRQFGCRVPREKTQQTNEMTDEIRY
jgi:hypothetical protein